MQPFVGGGPAGVEQVHAGQELLPGAVRSALLVQGRGVDPVRLELGGAQDALPAVVEVLEGPGDSGVLWFMTRPFPAPAGPLTAVTRSSTKRDKPALKYGRSTAEKGRPGDGLRPEVPAFGNSRP